MYKHERGRSLPCSMFLLIVLIAIVFEPCLGMAFWLGAYWQLQLLRMSIILNIVFFSFFDGIVIPRGALLSNESGSL